jgi:hypothetical protein
MNEHMPEMEDSWNNVGLILKHISNLDKVPGLGRGDDLTMYY